MVIKDLIIGILSEPGFEPPEGILGLSLNTDLHGLLTQLPKRASVEFALGEAELVLPLWEAAYPDDAKVRDALSTVRGWLEGSSSISEVRAAYAAAAAAAAYHARVASGVSLEDQLRRLLQVMRHHDS